MPLNLGPTEMVFILVILLVLFGAKRLPELGSGLGKGIREFKKSMHEIKADVERPDERRDIHPGTRSTPAVGAGPVDATTAHSTTENTASAER